MLSCRNCGAPYTGGIICEKCGTRYAEEELQAYEKNNTDYREKETQENSAKISHSGSSADNPAFIVAIIFAAVSALVIIPVLIAIFVPAIIGYNAKKQAAEERQAAVVQEIEESFEAEEKRGVDKVEYMKEHGVYSSGNYECGKDIPEGEYIVVSSGSDEYGDFYFGVYTQSDCSDDSELYGGWYQRNMYVSLKEGQFIHFSHSVLYDPELNNIELSSNQCGGMYKVGKDIEPGIYYIRSSDDQYGCEYTIYSSIDSVIPIEKESSYCDLSDSDSVKVELSEGEYIKLKFGSLEKAE